MRRVVHPLHGTFRSHFSFRFRHDRQDTGSCRGRLRDAASPSIWLLNLFIMLDSSSWGDGKSSSELAPWLHGHSGPRLALTLLVTSAIYLHKSRCGISKVTVVNLASVSNIVSASITMSIDQFLQYLIGEDTDLESIVVG